MINRILFLLVLLFVTGSCKREKTVVEASYPDGLPKRVCIYRGSGDNKELLRETTYYPGKKIQMDGDYRNNKRDGRWVYNYSNGNTWSEGFFKDGLNDGKRTIYFVNGKLRYEGYYNRGERAGKWRFYDEKGNLLKEIDYSAAIKK